MIERPLWVLICLMCALAVAVPLAWSGDGIVQEAANRGERVVDSGSSQRKEEDRPKRYHWLFKERKIDESEPKVDVHGLLHGLDREIKEARRLYLSGDLENAILKYRSAVDGFEAILDDLPQASPLLKELDDRFQIFDELATKILGPLHAEISEEASGGIFHVLEKRRICRRHLVMKKLTRLEFFDVPDRLVNEESRLLQEMISVRLELSSQEVRKSEETLKSQLAKVRQEIQKNSDRYTLLRAGLPIALGDFKKDVLSPKELVLDMNLLPDRIVIGVITKEKSQYYQFGTGRLEIDKGVFQLQDKLREFSQGDKATFMGHAWKEPCRRLYRTLLGSMPALPAEKTTILVIPDRSLWFLPLSTLLDSEDRPFGQDRVISFIPSADLLKLIRSGPSKQASRGRNDIGLLLFESIPWIPEDQVKESMNPPKGDKRPEARISDEERLERLILTNEVYPKPSDLVVSVQKFFRSFEVWVGPAATMDRFLDRNGRKEDVTILALPLSTWDAVFGERQPTFFFSPDKRGQRNLIVQRFFSVPTLSKVFIMPVAWFNVPDKENPSGDGPLLLNLALFYSGVKLAFINYSDPNWGGDEPFLMTFLKRSSEKVPVAKILAEYPREMPSGLDSSFSGKPPSWAGWILSGDVGIQ
ncbi:MAG: hypothetical protein QG577_2088 [Thermodesulfobacteriota bacterium]|nr:hypothetical protein [Thermodesulfobacteriota bacterium]